MNMPFAVEKCFVTIDYVPGRECIIQASVKVVAGGAAPQLAIAEGDTPAQALSRAMGKALYTLFQREFGAAAPALRCNREVSLEKIFSSLAESFAQQMPGRQYGQGD